MDHQAFAQLLGNYGEFLGAIAVVVTLFYLATQIRRSTEATKAMVRQGVDSSVAAYISVAIDPLTLVRGRNKFLNAEPLDEIESQTVLWHNLMDFKCMEGNYRQYQRGFIDNQDWSATEGVIRLKFRTDPIALELWESSETDVDMTQMFAADYRARVLALLNESRISPPNGGN